MKSFALATILSVLTTSPAEAKVKYIVKEDITTKEH